MADYINKKELLDEAYECKSNIQYTSPYQNEISTMVSGMERIIDIIEDAFAEDVVPVVRCSQCRKRYTTECALWFSQLDDKQYFCGAIHNDDFYCSYGERKEGNG